MTTKIRHGLLGLCIAFTVGCTNKMYQTTIKGHYDILASIIENNDSAIVFGKIMNKIDLLPIPYSWIKVEGTAIGMSADSFGNYLLKVPVGEYIFKAESAGNKELKTKPIKMRRGQKLQIDFYLGSVNIY